MENILAAIIVLALCFAGFAVRIIFKQGGTFRGSCSSMNVTGDEECSICGKKVNEADCLKK